MNIQFIPFTEKVLENYESNYMVWFEDPIVTLHNSHGLFPYVNMGVKEFFAEIHSQKRIVWAIMDFATNTHIGNVSLQSFNWINRSTEFAIVIGETRYWGKGIGLQALKFTVTHAFDKLNLNRVWSGTSRTNKGMQKVFEKFGMPIEGIFRQGMYLRGEYQDILIYSVLKKDLINE